MLVGRVIQVKVEVTEEQVVSGVDGEGGSEISEEVAKNGLWAWWAVDQCVPLMVVLPSICSWKFKCSMEGMSTYLSWWYTG